jgi:iron complex transport system substrate-binding protein
LLGIVPAETARGEMRVVSLLPSATEIIARVGGTDLLVGRSHECDWPEGLGDLPVLTAQRTAFDASSETASADIDERVRASMEAREPLYTLDTGLLAELEPDVIVTQDLCDVCSIDLGTVRGAAAEMARKGRDVDVVTLAPETFEGVLDDHLTVGRAIGMEAEASRAVVELRGRWLGAESYVNPYTEKPSVGFLEWTDPLFIAGHWSAQMIERAGGRHPLNETVPKPGSGAAAGLQAAERVAGKSIAVPGDVFAASLPEFLVICPCGLGLDDAVREAERLRDRAEWWGGLPAVRRGRVAVVDGSAMFNRPGPRLVDAFSWLVGWINDRPHLIPDGFPWRSFG